ncbi:MAG TPA: GDSL-type esterase/lipase family protein [Blastocatellia bacterium]|nr:GDSL-type esterase/lipase family protein [Blastocatellia bacterium]
MELQKKRFDTRKILHKFLYVCFLVCIIPLLCEGVVRVYSWLFLPKQMKIDSALGWCHASNSQRYRTTEGVKVLVVQNKLGHRGPNYESQTASGKKRVLVLGDSFTEGSHVGEDELFSNIIANTYSNLEVMNAGVGGWSTVQEYLYLKEFGINLHPNLVLLMFYDNDLDENCLSFYPAIGPRPFASIQNGRLVINQYPSPEEWRKYVLPLPFAQELNQYSLAYNFINFRVYQTLRAPYLNRLEYEDVKKVAACPKMEILKKLFQEARQMLTERGILFAVGLVPSKKDAQRGISDLQAPILSLCEAEGIPCLSLLRPLKEEYDKGVKPYWDSDIHWNKIGHRAASEALGPYIQAIFSSGR